AAAAGDPATFEGWSGEVPGARILGPIHPPGAIPPVAFAPGGRDLVPGSGDGSLQLTRDGEPPVLLAHLPAAVDIAGFASADRVIVADARPRLSVLDTTRRTPAVGLDAGKRTARLRPSPDCRRLLTAPPARAR